MTGPRPTRLYEAYVFDLDGTIYLGDEPLPGAARLVAELRQRQIPVRFLSNNATRDPEQYAAKLTALGIETPVSDITNTVVTTIAWLREHRPQAVVFPVAPPAVTRALAAAGFEVSDDPARIDVVISSYDTSFDYRKLQVAFDALWRRPDAVLVETNPDRYCPYPGGRGEPDAAAITAAIEACTGVRKVASLGKPEPVMIETALADLDVDPADVVMVGDRLGTDIAMAARAGLASALVLTGDSTREEAAALPRGEQPTYVLERIDELLPASVWQERGWRGLVQRMAESPGAIPS